MANDASKIDYLWHVHQYTHEYIRFADAKAGIAVGWTGALLSLFVSDKICATATVPCWVVALTFGILAISFGLAAVTLVPRLWRQDGRPGFIFWNDIIAHNRPETFVSEFAGKTDAELSEHLSKHLFVVAQIASRKYSRVMWSIGLALLGSLLGGWILLTRN